MASLKKDTALAVNLLSKDTKMRQLMDLNTKDDVSQRVVPMRSQPNEAMSKPLINIYIKNTGNLGGRLTSNELIIDVYTPLIVQRTTGISFDITRRVVEILDGKPIGRELEWLNTDPDKRSTTGWHKATVTFTFFSTQY